MKRAIVATMRWDYVTETRELTRTCSTCGKPIYDRARFCHQHAVAGWRKIHGQRDKLVALDRLKKGRAMVTAWWEGGR